MKLAIFLGSLLALVTILAFSSVNNSSVKNHLDDHSIHQQPDPVKKFPYQKTEKEWKEILTSKEFRILRKKGTEVPFFNEYNDLKDEGLYVCAGCGQKLYSSDHKYESGSGWPSFWKPISDSLVVELEDNSYFMTRTEIVCSNCGGHLGHVFDDGPEPTGLRYCMNSAAMNFIPKEDINK
ncbi:peptide-methionine (R)-S-oxide reductase MsrB [Balneola vulgaris]|uniref:peptide-methionine (R)-S-oxide reductase MsrB n=1 Tax=Balneola vulgaris TaxID=287535 RepID=UPI0003652C9A|nr:peptide-methionine (R)-S-oxide reductase MsrB [Balneola vulgaris]